MCKNLLTVYLKSIMKALVLLAIGMFALPNDARAQCGDVPNTQGRSDQRRYLAVST